MKQEAPRLGAVETAAWLEERGLAPIPHWYVELELRTDQHDTIMTVNIYPEEWGFVFRRGHHVSSIRVTNKPFVHGADDDRLVGETPPLERLHELLVTLERRFSVTFYRLSANVHTNLIRAAAVIRPWLNKWPS